MLFPWWPHKSWDVPADAQFLCNNAALLTEMENKKSCSTMDIYTSIFFSFPASVALNTQTNLQVPTKVSHNAGV
jgi:hypothetical protein